MKATREQFQFYVYLLLHSLAHQLMHALADTSGVDRDGIGEHIFPADLSFVIYRKGMTPDLGNVSAMWRNSAEEFSTSSTGTKDVAVWVWKSLRCPGRRLSGLHHGVGGKLYRVKLTVIAGRA